MRNDEFETNKQWDNKNRLKDIITNRVLKDIGIELPIEMCNSLVNYVNPDKQMYLKCYDLSRTGLGRDVKEGYSSEGGLIKRYYITTIVGNPQIGYIQNSKVVSDTIIKNPLTVLKLTTITTGVRNSEFINKIKNTIIFIKGVDYENRFTDVKGDVAIMQEQQATT